MEKFQKLRLTYQASNNTQTFIAIADYFLEDNKLQVNFNLSEIAGVFDIIRLI